MSPVCAQQAAARRVARRGGAVVGGEEEGGAAGAARMRLAAAHALGHLGCCLPSSARLVLALLIKALAYAANLEQTPMSTNMLLLMRKSRPHHTVNRNRAWWLCGPAA